VTTAYRINIALNLVTNSSTATRGIVRELGIVEASAIRLRSVLGTLGIGFSLAAGIREMAKATSDYGHQLAILHSVIRDNKQMLDAQKSAWSVSFSTPTSTAAGNLKAIGDLVPAFGNANDAIKNIDSLQKLSAVITNLGGNPDQAFDIAKALETRGAANDPARFRRESGEMVQASEATHGRVDAGEFLKFVRQSNPFATGFSDQFLYRVAPTLMQDMGGSRAGTALNSFENTLVGGRMTKAAKNIFQQMGLLDAHASYQEGSAGTVQLKGSQVRGADLALSDPNRWINEVLAPAMVSHGFTTPKQQEALIAKLFSNRNSERIAVEFDINRTRYAKDAGIIGQTENPFNAYDRLKDTDPKMLGVAIWSQLQDVLVNIGKDALPVALPLMRDFGAALVELNKALQGVSSVFDPYINTFKALGNTHISTDTGGSYGQKWHNALNWLGIGSADNSVPPPNKQSSSGQTGNVYLDSRKVGTVLWSQAGKQMSVPNNSGSSPDPRMSYVPNN
jgi:hypothetical protein